MANPKILIDLDTNELQELLEGKRFHWTYPDSTGRKVDLEIYNPDYVQELPEDPREDR